MLEFYLFSAIAGLGMMLNQRRSAQQELSPSNIGPKLGAHPSVNASSQPSGSNIYASDHARRAALLEREAARRTFQASKNPKLTGVIPRHGLDKREHRDFHRDRTSTQPTMVESPLKVR